jgi:hypothetical protein
VFVDQKGLNDEGSLVYVIVNRALEEFYSIIAFRSDPVMYAGFQPEILFASDTKTLFIGAGTVVKTFDVANCKVVSEKNYGFGFWGWHKYNDYILYQEETALGAYATNGQPLWETQTGPPCSFSVERDTVSITFDGKKEIRNLADGKLVAVLPSND